MNNSKSLIPKDVDPDVFAQIQARQRQQKLKLILTSGIGGAALALGGLWAYNTLATNFTFVRQSTDLNNANGRIASNSAQPFSYGTNFSGKVERYLLNPEGLVEGFILDNYLQVMFPPHIANSLVTTVKPGDSVTVIGFPGIFSNFGQEVHAESITNIRTQRTVLNQPSPYPPPPVANNYSNLSVEGTAQQWLVGHRGEIRGIILSSRTQVKFPAHVGDQLFNTAKRGDFIQAQGFGTTTNYGQVLEATSLTVNGQAVNFYPEGPRHQKRHNKLF